MSTGMDEYRDVWREDVQQERTNLRNTYSLVHDLLDYLHSRSVICSMSVRFCCKSVISWCTSASVAYVALSCVIRWLISLLRFCRRSIFCSRT